MPNKFYNDLSSKGGGKVNPADAGEGKGTPAPSAMPMKTAAWPGLPGKTGPERSLGTPKRGKRGPFHVKQEGL